MTHIACVREFRPGRPSQACAYEYACKVLVQTLHIPALSAISSDGNEPGTAPILVCRPSSVQRTGVAFGQGRVANRLEEAGGRQHLRAPASFQGSLGRLYLRYSPHAPCDSLHSELNRDLRYLRETDITPNSYIQSPIMDSHKSHS